MGRYKEEHPWNGCTAGEEIVPKLDVGSEGGSYRGGTTVREGLLVAPKDKDNIIQKRMSFTGTDVINLVAIWKT